MQTTRHRVPNRLGDEVVGVMVLLLLVSIVPQFTANVRGTAAIGLGMALWLTEASACGVHGAPAADSLPAQGASTGKRSPHLLKLNGRQ